MNQSYWWIILLIILVIILIFLIVNNNQRINTPQTILAATPEPNSITIDTNGIVSLPGQQPVHISTITNIQPTGQFNPQFDLQSTGQFNPNLQSTGQFTNGSMTTNAQSTLGNTNTAVSCNCPNNAQNVLALPMQVTRGNIISQQYAIVGYIYLCCSSPDQSVCLLSGTACLCSYAFNNLATAQDIQNFTNVINSLTSQGRIRSTCTM